MTGHILQALSAREMERGPSQQTDSPQWKHWKLAEGEQGIVWLTFDKQDTSANVVSTEVLEELEAILEKLHLQPPKGLVIRSTKASGFCLGADIGEFRKLESRDEAAEKLARAHEVVNRLDNASYTTVAVIHGACLGGGLELALACNYRIAVPGAKLGFPEVKLGLHPGLGGTARLTRLIDPMEAMTLMLTGKTVPHQKAEKLGMVDQVVEERHVASAVAAAVAGDIDPAGHGLRGRVLSTRPARQLETRQMRSKAAEKAPPEHYPAPEALIRLWEEHGGDDEAMLRAEVDSFAELLMTDTSRNLVRVFFLQETMKGLTRTEAEPVNHIHVVGAGEMGADIAGWCAYNGLSVTLFDMEPEKVAAAVAKLADLCNRKHRTPAQRRDILDRLTPDFGNHGIEHADLVLEAVPEKVEIKQKVYEEAEARMKDSAILATNTSSIPLETLRDKLKDPGRLVGLHFFNPVAMMPLVEVVSHDKVKQAIVKRAMAFTGQIDRLPAPVTTAPGFLVNRVLTPYLVEAMVMLDEGIAAETIDREAEKFGMPVGPVELADQVGLDICLSVANMLRDRLDTPMPPPPAWLEEKVENGDLGKKTGKGLYHWKKGKAEKESKVADAPDDTIDRLLLPMLNACRACLREQVIESEDLADGAMIFGTGFAPFRGGPMAYARKWGSADIRQALEALANRYGDRFGPDPGWAEDESGRSSEQS
ncbi:3-hydroxyacyl-CoA dehydrogenase NAD-binding domain-containing protein [Marinobacter zhanjiangensis]|uniref:Fatty-acid oxidation protein subunit alpha n=1 Tax=Marinobacter zhanjiangensis TaxID=578215 RepID=A0ABQ3AW11_9GAMM|nr:3-hydroxyacyl-CoA dehydrogenase NAD-binding domain-containing protein [Marinobacter zhanjiangensis]GGY65688.1 fatty-acid oxidation protein subunit alpha [Marinobacter zhanjiangensis]